MPRPLGRHTCPARLPDSRLGVFYLFYGTARQSQVFRAEGNYEDFQRSAMSDFNAFIMEDFLGATFFHLILEPLLASLLGIIGGLAGGDDRGEIVELSEANERMGGAAREHGAIELLADPGQDAGEKETEHIVYKEWNIREIACAGAQSWW
jgi:hypothetical protein